MEKKLTTKVQKIGPKLPADSNNIANTLVIQPDDEQTLEKKGIIYAVFDVASKQALDVLLVTKVVNDVLHDAYFQSESVSPIQSVEKAILKLRDNIGKISRNDEGTDPMISFNIATTILWGNTLYVVQYGNTKTFLMREGEIKPISASSEGNFSVASGVVKDNDVIILATEDFSRKYPPEQLVGTSEIQMDAIGELQAAMIMKFVIEKKFSSSEVIDFGSKQQESNKNNSSEKPKRKFMNFKRLPKASSKYRANPIILIFVLLIIATLLGAVYFSKNKIKQLSTSEKQNGNDQGTLIDEITEPETNVTASIDPEQDRINKVIRIEPELFYDLSLVNASTNGKSLIYVENQLVATDETNKAYVSSTNTPKFEEVAFSFGEIGAPINYKDKLAYIEGNELKILDLATLTTENTYQVQPTKLLATYLDFLYTISGDTIYRYDRENGQINEETWASQESVRDAKALAVNVSIFAINKDDTLLKFTTGLLDDFQVEGMDKDFSNVKELITTTDLEYMYIADAGNKRVVVLTQEGVLKNQYMPSSQDLWKDIRDIAVNQEETILYVLDGNRIFEVELTQ